MKKFTLVELLVVIAVIGILASMLLPSLQKAREKGRQALCTSNLKQFGVAVEMYISENDSRFPARTYNGKNSQGRSWLGKNGAAGGRYSDEHSVDKRPLNPYLGIDSDASSFIAQCSSDNKSSSYGSYYNKYGSSYRANVKTDGNRMQSLANYSTGEGVNLGFSSSKVVNTSETFCISEYGGISVIYYTGSKYKWHFGDKNRWLYLFIDGSVKPISIHQSVTDSSGITINSSNEAYSGDGWKFYSADVYKP